jgi:hypothetical protein
MTPPSCSAAEEQTTELAGAEVRARTFTHVAVGAVLTQSSKLGRRCQSSNRRLRCTFHNVTDAEKNRARPSYVATPRCSKLRRDDV